MSVAIAASRTWDGDRDRHTAQAAAAAQGSLF
jgi:hypothetical protein